jgi:membrane-bound lytic murein transglycosylase D
MTRPKIIKHLVYTLLLTFSAPAAVHAIDISLHPGLPLLPAGPIALKLPPSDLPGGYPTSFEYRTFDLWERMRAGFDIPDLDNEATLSSTKRYSAQPEYFERTLDRASRYLYHVVEELEKRGMPMELALLPFIESSFDPHAVSSAKAAGMWQFIPSTGKFFNLKQNFFRDERRDILASTDAALTYLQKLYDMFGDWHLALAAYNWGEGSVQRAINKARAKGLGTDFETLSRFMPAETRYYVPKLLAVKNIINEPQRHAVTLPLVENEPYFVTVNKLRDIDVELAARLAELPMEEFRALNPQFNRPVIAGGPTTHILLPRANAEKFKANVEAWTEELSSWSTYTVKDPREKIETIAARFKTTPKVIRDVNNLPANVVVRAGSTLLVPKLANAATQNITREVADSAVLHYEPLNPPGKRMVIKVRKRDTLYGIAKRYKVTISELKKWNNLKLDRLQLGQTLKLFLPERALATAASKVRQAAKSSRSAKAVKIAKAKDKTKTVIAVRNK